MKKMFLMGAVAVLTVVGLSVSVPTPAAAQRDTFSFSFNTGDVAFAYSDGYYDNNRRWHKWRNAREHREFRNRYRDNYRDHRRSRERNMGWLRDSDRDGVPNRFDDRPRNPYRN